MKKAWKKIRNFFRTVGHYLGLFWTKILLGIFFVTIFAAAAVLVRIFTDPLARKRTKTTWHKWKTAGKKQDWFHPF